jgi:hypothetical protein
VKDPLPGSENQNGNGNDGGNGQGTPAQAPTAMTREQLQELMEEANSPLADALTQMAQTVQSLQKAAPAGKSPAAKGGAASGDADDFMSEILTNGREAVSREAMKAAEKILGDRIVPYLKQKATADRDTLITANRERIDRDYGEGFFDSQVAPMLLSRDGKSGALATLSVADQSLPHVVEATVDGIIGRIIANPESRAKMLEGLTKSEAAKAAQRKTLNPARTLGPGLPRGTKPTEVEIPDDIRDTLTDFRKLGIDFTEQDLVDAHALGNSAEAWDAALKPKSKGKAA